MGRTDQSTLMHTLVLGLQKCGSTIMSWTLALALNHSFEVDAVWRCCKEVDGSGRTCFPQLDSPLFNGRLDQFMSSCSAYLRASVVKADDMLFDLTAIRQHFVRTHLALPRCVFLVRHPFANIRSLQAWHARQTTGGWLNSSTLLQRIFRHGASAAGLAVAWRDAARVYLSAPPGAFAALMRFEDFANSPLRELERVLGVLHPGATVLDPVAVRAALATQVQSRGNYVRHANMSMLLTPADAARVLAIAGAEMHQLDYSGRDVFARAAAMAPTGGCNATTHCLTPSWLSAPRPSKRPTRPERQAVRPAQPVRPPYSPSPLLLLLAAMAATYALSILAAFFSWRRAASADNAAPCAAPGWCSSSPSPQRI